MRKRLKKVEKLAKILTIVFGAYALVALVMAFAKQPLPYADVAAIVFAIAAVAWAFAHDEREANEQANKKEDKKN